MLWDSLCAAVVCKLPQRLCQRIDQPASICVRASSELGYGEVTIKFIPCGVITGGKPAVQNVTNSQSALIGRNGWVWDASNSGFICIFPSEKTPADAMSDHISDVFTLVKEVDIFSAEAEFESNPRIGGSCQREIELTSAKRGFYLKSGAGTTRGRRPKSWMSRFGRFSQPHPGLQGAQLLARVKD